MNRITEEYVLSLFNRHCSYTTKELARKAGCSPTVMYQRVKTLEERGDIVLMKGVNGVHHYSLASSRIYETAPSVEGNPNQQNS
jgi:hypothetical protein